MSVKFKKNDVVEGIVSHITSYGAFVHIDSETVGLVHISEIIYGFVQDIHQFLCVGQRCYFKVLAVDDKENKLRLSLKGMSKRRKVHIPRRHRALSRRKSLLPPAQLGFSSLALQLPLWIRKELEKND